MQKLQLKPADYIIIGLLIIAGLAGFWYNYHQGGQGQQKYAVIYVDNQVVAELSLNDSDHYQYSFPFGNGAQHEAVIEVDGGRVRMLEMDTSLCPRGICAHTGWIEHSYESIVCLPNRIMIVFREADSDGLDGITF